jgi:hypothetical protein
MLSKTFLSSAIAILTAAGAIATPVASKEVSARDADFRFPDGFNKVVTPFAEVASNSGITKPAPKKAPVFPSVGDVPESVSALGARDTVSIC